MKIFVLIFASLLLSSCGGGGGSGQPTSYSMAVPTVGAERISNVTFLDNSNNTIAIQGGLRIIVTAVNADGSFVYHQDDPTNNSSIVNGTNYAVRPVDINANSFGQTKSITDTANNTTCTFSPNGGGPTYPVQLGSEWSATWVETCGASPAISYSQTGKVIGIESITVAAGTFTALHLALTTSHTDLLGTTRSIRADKYKRTSDLMTVKIETTYSYSGTLPVNGYPITRVEELQSYH